MKQFGNNDLKQEFIKRILFGTSNSNIINHDYDSSFSNIKFKDSGLNDTINNKKFIEYLGVYYQEEVKETEEDSSVPNSNKNKKRVITYVLENN